jgi:predicted esterase
MPLPLLAILIACRPSVSGPEPTWDPSGDSFWSTPWPSDTRRRDDGTLDMTGFPNPYNLPFLDDYVQLAETIVGFGNNSPIYISFDGPIDTSLLPDPLTSLSGASPLALVDIDPRSPSWGERFPLQWRFDELETQYKPSNLLAVAPLPGFPLRPDTTYALVVTTDIASPNLAFQEAAWEGELASAFDGLEDALLPLGLERERVAIATVFTTQDPIQEMATITRFLRDNIEIPDLSQPVTSLNPFLFGSRFDVWRADYAGPMFQHGERPYKAEGGDFAFGAGGTPLIAEWDQMRLAISTPTTIDPPAGGYPVVIYQHGTGGDYLTFADQSAELEVATLLAEAGMVGLGIDQPLHGSRGTPDTDVDTDTFNYLNPSSARALFRQGAIDAMYLAHAIASHDTVFTTPNGDEIPLDRDRILFMGHSQGGLTGALALPFMGDEVHAAVLSGAGGGLAITVTERADPFDIASLLTVLLGFDEGETISEFHPAVGVLQLLVEVTDPINYAPYWFDQPGDWTGHQPASVLMTSGLLDAQTPHRSAEALAAAGRLPQVDPSVTQPEAFPLRGLTPLPAPIEANATGYDGATVTAALSQWDDPADHFVVFTDERAARMYQNFLATAADGDASIDIEP